MSFSAIKDEARKSHKICGAASVRSRAEEYREAMTCRAVRGV